MSKAPMTPAQIRAAGYWITRGVPPGTRAEPWSIMRLHTKPQENIWVLRHYRTRHEAITDLHEELTDPDGVLRPEPKEG